MAKKQAVLLTSKGTEVDAVTTWDMDGKKIPVTHADAGYVVYNRNVPAQVAAIAEAGIKGRRKRVVAILRGVSYREAARQMAGAGWKRASYDTAARTGTLVHEELGLTAVIHNAPRYNAQAKAGAEVITPRTITVSKTK